MYRPRVSDPGSSRCFPLLQRRHLAGRHCRQLPRPPQRRTNPISTKPEQCVPRELGRRRSDHDGYRGPCPRGDRFRVPAPG